MKKLLLILPILFSYLALAGSSAFFVTTFTLEYMPLRDLGINCGNGLFLFGDTYLSLDGLGWRPNTGGILNRNRPVAINQDNALWYPDGDAFASVPSGCAGWLAFYTDAYSLSGNDFQAVSSGVVVSYDAGATWTKFRLFEGDGQQAQASLFSFNGTIYAFMTAAGRVSGAQLARTTDPTSRDAWSWWNGANWGPVEQAVEVIGGKVGESSVCHNGSDYVIAYADPDYNGIIMRTAPTLIGAWSEAEMLVDWGEYHGTYAPQWLQCGRTFLLSHFEDTNINGAVLPRYNVYQWSR